MAQKITQIKNKGQNKTPALLNHIITAVNSKMKC